MIFISDNLALVSVSALLQDTREEGEEMELKPRVKEAERTNASVMYSLQALDYLETEGAASLNDLSAALSINKSRVLRLCGTLEQMGYLRRRAEDAKWVLGSRLLSLGKAFERQNPLLQVLRPEMLELSQQLDENVVFQVIRGERRLCLCAVNRVQRQRYFTPEGSEARLHYGAAGKVLLAWGPPELRARIYEQAPYPRYTEHTRTTAEELMADIEKAAAEGWAASCEERTYGSAALAVPVFGAEGALLGALSIPTTAQHLTPEFMQRALPLLKKSAEFIRSTQAGAQKFVPVVPRRD